MTWIRNKKKEREAGSGKSDKNESVMWGCFQTTRRRRKVKNRSQKHQKHRRPLFPIQLPTEATHTSEEGNIERRERRRSTVSTTDSYYIVLSDTEGTVETANISSSTGSSSRKNSIELPEISGNSSLSCSSHSAESSPEPTTEEKTKTLQSVETSSSIQPTNQQRLTKIIKNREAERKKPIKDESEKEVAANIEDKEESSKFISIDSSNASPNPTLFLNHNALNERTIDENVVNLNTTSKILRRNSNTSHTSSNYGHLIRSELLDGSVFNSDEESFFEACSHNESTVTSCLDQNENVQMNYESENHSVIVNFPFSAHDEKNVKDVKNGLDADSDDATVASEDFFLTQLEELYSDIFKGEKEEDFSVRDRSGKSSLIPGDRVASPKSGDCVSSVKSVSSHSSVLSFDSMDFLEDDEFMEDDYDDVYCQSQLSLHDITTIEEENKEDVEEEEGIMEDREKGLLFQPKGEISIKRHFLVSQQGSEFSNSLSSVTDSSYMDLTVNTNLTQKSQSTMNTQNSIREGISYDDEKTQDEVDSLDMSSQSAFYRSSKQANANMRGDSSQFTFESSKVSISNSVLSTDSISSESVRYMVDVLKQEAERRSSKIRERIARLREQADSLP